MRAKEKTADEIFQRALEFADPEERQSYLRTSCDGNSALLAEVESLLAAHAAMGAFLQDQTEACFVEPRAIASEMSGDVIGRYKLLDQIGEGGFGVVWLAEQREPVRRPVALKIIKLGMDTKQVVARFEAERQALAMMDHPNIARVFDAGATATGRPYFVMELVKGVPITEYCNDRRLTPEATLKLFIQVCHGVQHAHQKGIIHRDLKPSNILVTLQDDQPIPKIIDFGIAKATEERLTDHTLFTRVHQLLGTPSYMSPEQAGMTGLDVDTRSDIYSLGVLLYELLTGCPPFSKEELVEAGFEGMCRIIREKEPCRPSTKLSTLDAEALREIAQRRQVEPRRFVRTLKGDLDWIVMKCLEKDRARRYPSANGLALDLQRALHNEPVTARPPGALYQLQKLVRRQKAVFAGAAAITLLLVGSLMVTSKLLVREQRARRDASAAAEREAEERQRATDRLWDAYLAQAKATRWSGRQGRRFGALDAIAKAAAIRPSLELRNEAIAAMALVDLRVTQEFEWGVLPHGLGYSDDLKYYTLHEGTGRVTVRGLRDGSLIHDLPGFGEEAWMTTFSADNRYLAVKYHTRNNPIPKLGVWDLRGPELILNIVHGVENAAAAFSGDNLSVAGGKRKALCKYTI